MYSDVFCKVYNEFGWNYYPEIFGQELLLWLEEEKIPVKRCLDLACGTGILCRILHQHGAESWGMDLSHGMIDIARESCPEIHYEVADMTAYRPEATFDLVTCTGDALNHIMALSDVEKIFHNVYAYLREGGYFLFDLLKETEVGTEEPFDLPFSDAIQARFQMLRLEDGTINLKTQVFEDGAFRFEENIYETLHDPAEICRLLKKAGFREILCRDRLLIGSQNASSTWYVIAKK